MKTTMAQKLCYPVAKARSQGHIMAKPELPTPRREAGDTFIYFLRAGEFVKIGHSARWKNRMAGMQTGSPYTIVPLLVLVGKADMERKLHVRFRIDHFRGEWFHMGPAIRAFIKENLKDCVAKSDNSDLRPPPETWDTA